MRKSRLSEEHARDQVRFHDDRRALEFLVSDVSACALQLLCHPSSSEASVAACRKMLRKREHDPARYERVWRSHVEVLDGRYAMAPEVGGAWPRGARLA